jgi:transposase-like protein
MLVLKCGAMRIRASTTDEASARAMKMATASVKSMCNTMEGFWSLLRSWLRPHRGISQEKLPLYLGFFEFVHHVRKRGKTLLPALIELLVT